MAYQTGDVVLVPFPFTDMSTTKVRPALVVSTPAYENATGSIVVAMITSTTHKTKYDCRLTDWQEAKLLYPSTVRMKLASLDPTIVLKRIGQVTPDDLHEVQMRLKLLLGI